MWTCKLPNYNTLLCSLAVQSGNDLSEGDVAVSRCLQLCSPATTKRMVVCSRNSLVARPCHTLNVQGLKGRVHLYSAHTQPLEQGAEHLRDSGQHFATGTEAGQRV